MVSRVGSPAARAAATSDGGHQEGAGGGGARDGAAHTFADDRDSIWWRRRDVGAAPRPALRNAKTAVKKPAPGGGPSSIRLPPPPHTCEEAFATVLPNHSPWQITKRYRRSAIPSSHTAVGEVVFLDPTGGGEEELARAQGPGANQECEADEERGWVQPGVTESGGWHPAASATGPLGVNVPRELRARVGCPTYVLCRSWWGEDEDPKAKMGDDGCGERGDTIFALHMGGPTADRPAAHVASLFYCGFRAGKIRAKRDERTRREADDGCIYLRTAHQERD
ncbi:hypothetical protein DFH07DRAFT_943381 [Mycena maculata]|uniref:Uncharacterized protein n=1 Tax=Mycena maculata TaxID=230809 RepID=A0AAD7IHR0_9AGAR|nr:hypothetical protein DFH07DRAFT_943381 [Mycena maculata]